MSLSLFRSSCKSLKYFIQRSIVLDWSRSLESFGKKLWVPIAMLCRLEKNLLKVMPAASLVKSCQYTNLFRSSNIREIILLCYLIFTCVSIRPIAKIFFIFFLKVHLKISLNPKFQNFRVTRWFWIQSWNYNESFLWGSKLSRTKEKKLFKGVMPNFKFWFKINNRL